MTEAWRIRPADEADLAALALVGAATFIESFAGVIDGAGVVAHCARHHSEEAYSDYLANGAQAWLAEVAPGHAPVGYALLCTPELEIAMPGDIELKRIYVFSRFHGGGIAAALMTAALAAARGSARLLLGVKDDNRRAIAFYRKHGFEPVGTRDFDVGGHSYHDLVLARPLTD